jgi:hypothetical protein
MYGGSEAVLEQYLDESPLVAIGAIAGAMHRKDESVLRGLIRLAERHGPALHCLGLTWPKAITRLDGMIHSHDSSLWLRAARYGHVVFKNTRYENLQSAPAKVLGLGHLTRRERLLEAARAIDGYCNGHEIGWERVAIGE